MSARCCVWMWARCCAWILAVLLALSLADTDQDAADHVMELGDTDFDTAISTHPLLLVEFYAPW